MKSMTHFRPSGTLKRFRHSSNILMLLLLFTSIPLSSQTTWNVTNSADAGANTLREAIDNSVNGDIININVSSEIRIDSGLYVFYKDLVINGNGSTINSSGSKNYTFYFEITNIKLNNLTMKNLNTNFPVITAYNAGSLTLDGCIIEDNPTTSVKGGAIYSEIPVVIKSCTIQDNTAASGAGIHMDFNSLTIQNSLIKDNTATGTQGGGGISCIGSLEITDSEILNNSASGGSAGGLFVINSGITKITNSQINNNTSRDDAGGCFILSALDLTDSEISDNTCGGTGGGVYFVSAGGTTPSKITNSTILHNTAHHSGGVNYKGTSLTVKDSHIESNKANQASGGGLFIGSGKLTLENSTVNNNEAASVGGGIYSNVDCIIDQSEINSNTSSDKGGGIYMYDGKLELKNQSKINSNTARIDGGGIYLNSSASTQFIANNSSINDNKTMLYGGGGVHIRPNGYKKILTNCEVNGNTANTEGGGIYNQGDLELNHVTMKENKGRFGGGLYVYSGMADIDHTTINENEAITDGGGVYSRTRLTIENNSTINDNKAGQTGGGLWISHSGQSSIISQSDVNGNKALRAAGILLGNGTITIQQMSNVNDNQNTGHYAGAGIYNGNTALTINSSSVSNNTTPANGGGVYVDNSGGASLTTDQADISGNTAGQNGGGVYLSTTADIQNSTFNNNSATGPGGGLYIREFGGAQLNISGSTLNNNTSSYGGGIMLYHNNSSNTITNCELKNNEVTKQGGGLWVKANATISETTFEDNTAATEGGGIFMDLGTSTLTSSTLSMNSAVQGAGLYMRTGDLDIRSTNIELNESFNAGGGLFQSEGALSISSQSSINNNESTNTSGGGIYVDNGELTLNNSEVNNNKVKNGGGGIYLNSKAKVKFSAENSSIIGNTTRVYGGGGLLIKANNHKKTIRNCIIQGNTAKLEGGGLANNGELEILDNTIIKNNESETSKGGGIYCQGQLDLDQVTITENQAKDGGGLYANTGSAIIKNNSSLTLNKATHNGGAIYSNINLDIKGTTVNHNTATNDGGGIYSLSKLDISNQSSINENTAGQTGGGLWISHSGKTTTISASDVNENKAWRAAGILIQNGALTIEQGSNVNDNTNIRNYDGAGIYNENAMLTINSSSVKNNTTSAKGGGIYVRNAAGASLTMDDVTISGNEAGQSGGGIFNNKHMEISNSTINSNKAIRYDGGGIYSISEDETILENTEIQSNIANSSGGGIFNHGLLIIKNSTISRNTANVWNGGGLYSSSGNVTIENNSLIQSNEAGQYGGGLFLNAGSHKIKNTDVLANKSIGNSGGGIYFKEKNLTLEHVKVNNNSSEGNKGGGIHNEKGALTIKNSEIIGNSALTWGGGIYSSYLDGAISFSISDSEINGNSANNGGGISVDVINAYNIAQTEFNNNKAIENGGGIYIIGGSGTVNIEQTTIENNEATRGGGIYNTSMDLKVSNSDINRNKSSHNGGGVYNSTQKITLTNSEVNGNESSYNGGGVWNSGTLDISTSSLRDNTAVNYGGAIHNINNAVCEEIIAEGNSSMYGGGISNVGNLTLDYTTITNNTANIGGGLQNLNSGSYHGNMILSNSIVSLNNGTSGTDIHNAASINGDHILLSDYDNSGLMTTGTNNLTGDPLFVSDFSNLNLTECSPAIDAASNGDDMGALQSGLTAIVPVITTTSLTASLDDQHPTMVSLDPSIVQYNFGSCSDIIISLDPVDYDCSHVGQTITTTATVTYSGGRSFQQDIPVIVLDDVAPEFTSFPQDTIYLQNSEELPVPDPVTFADNCGGMVTLNVSDGTTIDLECGARINRIYAISDVHGNSTSFVQTIIVGDGMGPEIIVFDEEKMDVVDLSAPPRYSVHHDTSFTDFTSDEVQGRYCGQSRLIRRTYTAEDACHNVTVETRNIMFSDEEKPLLVKEADFLKGIESGDTIDWVDCIYPDPSRNDISWSDNSGSATVKSHVYDLPLTDSVPFGMFKFLNYEYTVEDECMNSSDLDFYMGLYDLNGPIFQFIPNDTSISQTQDLPLVPDDVVILDVCNYVVWDTVVTRAVVDHASGDTTAFSRKWLARDVVGHETFEEQIIHVQPFKKSYAQLTARMAFYDKLIPEHFEGETGENDIHFTLYHLDTIENKKIPVNETTTQNWFGRNGTIWFTGIFPGRYQIKMDLPEGYYIQPDTIIDSLGWSGVLTFSGEELVDWGLLVLTPIPEEVDSIVLDSATIDSVAVDSLFVNELTHISRNEEWKVYPNPSNGQVKIEFDSNLKRQYELFDRTGKSVRSGQVSGGEMLDLDGLVNGIYILQLREGDVVLGHRKLMLMR